MSEDKQETVSIATFKNRPFSNDFTILTDDGKVLSALCKCFSEVQYNDVMREATFRNIKDSALKSVFYFRKNLLYTPR